MIPLYDRYGKNSHEILFESVPEENLLQECPGNGERGEEPSESWNCNFPSGPDCQGNNFLPSF